MLKASNNVVHVFSVLPTNNRRSKRNCQQKNLRKFYEWSGAFVNLSENSGKFTNILSHFHFLFRRKKMLIRPKNVSNEQKNLRPNKNI